MRITYRVQSKEGKVLVVHHGNFKKGNIPMAELFIRGAKQGDFEVVHSLP